MPPPGMLPAEYPRHRPQPSTLCPCRVSSCRPWVPLFRGHETAIGTGFIPANLLLVVELGQEGPPEFEQPPRLFPLPEPPPTGARAPISPGQLAPLGAGPENPEEALKAAS